MNQERARKALLKLPRSVARAQSHATRVATSGADDVAISTFEVLKAMSKKKRAVPLTWEVEYDVDNALRGGALDRTGLGFERSLCHPKENAPEPVIWAIRLCSEKFPSQW